MAMPNAQVDRRNSAWYPCKIASSSLCSELRQQLNFRVPLIACLHNSEIESKYVWFVREFVTSRNMYDALIPVVEYVVTAASTAVAPRVVARSGWISQARRM